MRLRNKKTGDIGDYLCAIQQDIKLWSATNSYEDYYYKCLSEFINEWEDYKPVEPLIEDEKIRKAVRAWAEANRIDESRYRNVKFDHSEHRLKWIRTIIEFDSVEGLENLDDGKEYTITELCGDEE